MSKVTDISIERQMQCGNARCPYCDQLVTERRVLECILEEIRAEERFEKFLENHRQRMMTLGY